MNSHAFTDVGKCVYTSVNVDALVFIGTQSECWGILS